MVKSMTLDFADFKVLLHDFADLVSDKHYNKMDYHMWRKVSSTLRPDNTSVFIEWDNHAVDITFGEESEWHHFVFGNNSFGDFMWENLLKDSEYEYEYNAHNSKLDIAANETLANCGDKIKAAGAETKERLLDSLASVPLMTISTSTSEPTFSFSTDTKVDKVEFESKLEELSAKVQAVADKYNNIDKKENSVMKGFNFDFGPMNANVVRMSIYGLAVKNKTGSWVAYDAKNEEIMDVDVFNFDGSKFMYRMPVAISDVAAGDVIVHMSVPMFVVGKSEDGKAVYAVDPVAGERKEIMLVRSPFGFNFVVKVINLLDGVFNGVQPSADNPFGNILPFLLMDEDKIDNPMLLMALSGNADFTSNPMMLYFLLKDGKSGSDESLIPLLFMMNANGNNNHTCKCHQGNSN